MNGFLGRPIDHSDNSRTSKEVHGTWEAPSARTQLRGAPRLFQVVFDTIIINEIREEETARRVSFRES
jgi:hypothetical protein